MRKAFRYVTIFVISLMVAMCMYNQDMKKETRNFAKERLETKNFATLKSDIELMMVYDEVEKKMNGKTLEEYLLDNCSPTVALRVYFKSKKNPSTEYYNAIRDIDTQLESQIDDLCEFLNEVDKKHPRVYVEDKK